MILNKPNIEKLQATKDIKRLVKALFWKPLCIFEEYDLFERISVQIDAIDALIALGDKRAVEPICKVLIHDEAVMVREHAARALRELRDPNSVNFLIAALEDEHPKVRDEAMWALGDIGDGRAIDPIGLLLLREKEKKYTYTFLLGIYLVIDDKGNFVDEINIRVREDAILILGKLGKSCPEYGERAASHLIKCLLHSDNVYREWSGSILMLIEIGEPAVKPLVAAVGDEKVKEYFLHFLDYKTGMHENIGEYALAWEKWWPYDIKSRIKPDSLKSERRMRGLGPKRKIISKRKAYLQMPGDKLWVVTLECGHERIISDMLLDMHHGPADEYFCEECDAEEKST